MTAPATIPIRAPVWTITSGRPTPEAIESLARVCVAIARQRIAERTRGQDGDEKQVEAMNEKAPRWQANGARGST